jgi:putative ABC transport system permease protein
LQDTVSLRQGVDTLLMPQRLGRALLTALGILALVLTAVGIYGLVSCVIARSTREIGIRMALGASPRDVARGLVTWTSWPLLFGLTAGVLANWFGGQLADRFLYGTTGSDPSVLALAAAAVVMSAALAIVVPLRRALHIDPIATLRSE